MNVIKHQMDNTASILIIGNEILSGKTEDTNSPYLCRELRHLGVDVQRITVLPDLEERIAEEVAKDSKQYTWVFTSGGVGPTHDDVTIKGIAQALSRRLFFHPALEQCLQEFYGHCLNEAQRKLAQVPEGAQLIFCKDMKIPVLTVENIHILPGVPEIMQKKFCAIKSRFQSLPFILRRIYIKGYEEEIAHHLHGVLQEFPKLLLGSYPYLHQKEYQVILTLESKDAVYLEASYHYLMNLLPPQFIFKTE
jgi:molybdenum cofactor synthesis domain-containing protein